jgi:hypothetical protein
LGGAALIVGHGAVGGVSQELDDSGHARYADAILEPIAHGSAGADAFDAKIGIEPF